MPGAQEKLDLKSSQLVCGLSGLPRQHAPVRVVCKHVMRITGGQTPPQAPSRPWYSAPERCSVPRCWMLWARDTVTMRDGMTVFYSLLTHGGEDCLGSQKPPQAPSRVQRPVLVETDCGAVR